MELKKKKKSDFSAISINRIVARRYREFSKKISKSHTQTLELMMDFFEEAKISPKNKYLMNYMGYVHYITKRFDYIEELFRNWEKNSTIPKIHEMLKKIFDYVEKEEESGRKDLEFQQKMLDHSLRRDKVANMTTICLGRIGKRALEGFEIIGPYYLGKTSVWKIVLQN